MENLKSNMKCHLGSETRAISKKMTFLLNYTMDFGFFGENDPKDTPTYTQYYL